jgi:hypothetical protein
MTDKPLPVCANCGAVFEWKGGWRFTSHTGWLCPSCAPKEGNGYNGHAEDCTCDACQDASIADYPED